MIPNNERCVCCGRYVPEGRMVCPICMENGSRSKNEKIDEVTRFLKDNHTGRDKAIIGENLEDFFGLSHRTFQRYIREIRKNGVPICSGNTGYYYAESQDEINDTVAWMNRMVTGVSNSRTGLLYAVISKPIRKKVKKIRIVMEQEEGNAEEISIVVEK